jgi:hypothetical protein
MRTVITQQWVPKSDFGEKTAKRSEGKLVHRGSDRNGSLTAVQTTADRTECAIKYQWRCQSVGTDGHNERSERERSERKTGS